MKNKIGFPRGKKNPKLSEIRKQMFKEGLLNVSGENNGMFGKHLSKKHRQILTSSHFKEFKHTEISKDKIKKAHLGKKHTEETKEKIGLKGELNPMYRKNHSKESIKKIKKARAKQKNTFNSSIEIKIQEFLKKLGITFFTHQYMKIEHGYQCDILIPCMNLVIECDGDYWHKYPIGKEVDHVRTKELIEKGFNVLRLWEFEIENMNLNDFKNKLGEVN